VPCVVGASLHTGAFGYSWAADLVAPYDGLTMIFRFDPDSFESFEINDWARLSPSPTSCSRLVTAAAVLGNRPDGTRVQVLPSEWPDLIDELSKTHLQLYETFASMTRAERVLSATRMYSWGLKPFADIAGVLDNIDWDISTAPMALYPDPLDEDEKAADAFATPILGTPDLSSFKPII